MIRVKSGGKFDKLLTFLRVPHLGRIQIIEWPMALFYILFTCKYQKETGQAPDPESMAATKQLLTRAALRGESVTPDEAITRLLSQECSGEELAAFVEKLAAGGKITDNDVSELFFSQYPDLKIRIPPKEYAEKRFFE